MGEKTRKGYIAFFGTGGLSQRLSTELNIDIDFYIDNNPKKQGTMFLSKEVYSLEHVISNYSDVSIFIVSSFYEDIKRQLDSEGLEEDTDYFILKPVGKNQNTNSIILEMIDTKMALRRAIIVNDLEKVNTLLIRYNDYFVENKVIDDEKIYILSENRLLFDDFIVTNIKNTNFLLYAQLYLAQQSIKESLYLKGLLMYEGCFSQTYEDSLFSINNDVNQFVLEQIELTNLLHRNELKNQLKAKSSYQDLVVKKYKNVHLMYMHSYTYGFIKQCNELGLKDNLYIVFDDGNRFSLDYSLINIFDNIIHVDLNLGDISEENHNIIKYNVYRSEKTFLHGLHNLFCKIVIEDTVCTKLCWIVWGGDIYGYLVENFYDEKTASIFEEKSDRSNFYNRRNLLYIAKVMRKLDEILVTEGNGIYKAVDEKFILTANESDFFYISTENRPDNNIKSLKEKNNVDEIINLARNHKYVFVVGHSGYKTGNHIDIIDWLSRFKEEDILVIAPLSYGDKSYIEAVKRTGEKVLGRKFYPILDFMDYKSYMDILNLADVIILNNHVREAIGNIRDGINLGKKIYLKNTELSAYNFFKEKGISVYDNDDLKTKELEEIVAYEKSMDGNIKKLNKLYDTVYMKERYIEYFS